MNWPKILKAWFLGWTLYVGFAGILFTVHGCRVVPDIEACFDHEKYGRICIVYRDGRVLIKTQLPPNVLEEVKAWLKEKGHE